MLELKNISYSVSDENSATKQDILKNINLKFSDNEISVITGPNGSGKSTMIKLLMGFVKPTSGEIYFNGQSVQDLSVTERAKLGFTIAFQQPVRFKGITVKKLMELSSGKKLTFDEMCNCLAAVGLCARNYIDRYVDGKLSGGEVKRIELASALAKGGEVFLLDEPEAGIDLWSFEDLVEIFEKLHNKTVIIVSHQQRIIEKADQLVLFDNDKLICAGKRDEVYDKIMLRNPNACWKNLKEAVNGQN